MLRTRARNNNKLSSEEKNEVTGAVVLLHALQGGEEWQTHNSSLMRSR